MALSLAYSKGKTPTGLLPADLDAFNPFNALEDFSLFCDSKRACLRAAQSMPIGTRVLVGIEEGHVLGYNIAGFGMWVGSVYPFLVSMADGSIKRCKPSELRAI
ncbi:MAG: hypothetical protein ACK5NY_06045 [Burkholderiaceae bacterium]|jgi:hypothetical protein